MALVTLEIKNFMTVARTTVLLFLQQSEDVVTANS